jgi:polyphenol oxidase
MPMIEADALKSTGIRHGFFTRRGGVSGGLYDSLNIGLGSKDSRENVLENRARVSTRLGASPDRLALPYQHHSADAIVVETAWRPGSAPKADAVVTASSGIALGISTADCGPVLFADTTARVIGAAHAGWRGALTGILESTIATMESLGARRRRIVAVLGPAISRNSYEVGPEFRATFLDHDPDNARFFADGPGGRPHFDLPAYILHRLGAAGIAHAENLARCTYREEDLFFSYRRATHRGEPDYGRLVSGIALTG